MSRLSVSWHVLWGGVLGVLLVVALASVAGKAFDMVRGLDRYESLVMADSLPYKPVGEIVDGMVIRQPFVPIADGLDRIRLHVATYARTNHAPLEFRLLDATGHLLVSHVIPPTLDERQFYTVSFDPIAHVAGRTVVIELTSPGARPGDAMTVWATDQLPAGYWSAKLAGRDIGRVLRFDYACRRHLDVETVAKRMGQFKPAPFKRPFNLALLLGLPLSMVILAIVVFRVGRGPDPSSTLR